jgi:hypothetical protein
MWCSGESCLTESQVWVSKQSLCICRGMLAPVHPFPDGQTPLMWEPLAMGLPFFPQDGYCSHIPDIYIVEC